MGFWVLGVNLNLLENVNANVVSCAYKDTGTVSLRWGGMGARPTIAAHGDTGCDPTTIAWGVFRRRDTVPVSCTCNGVDLVVNGVGR